MILLFCLPVFGLPSAAAAACELTIRVRGAEGTSGMVRIALFSSREAYKRSDARKKRGKQGEAFRAAAVSPRDGAADWSAGEIPCGLYGAAAYYDRNANGRLDSSFFGRPKEKYGFSNGARGKLGKPKFEEVAITVEGREEITITVE